MNSRSAARTAVVVLLSLGMVAASCAPQQGSHGRRFAKRAARTVAVRPPAPAYPVFIPWGEHTVETRLAEIGRRVRASWKRSFDVAAVAYPPNNVVLAAFKRERRVEVYAGPSPLALSLVRTLPITAASGGPGPKLREGDKQVPEGIYEIASLNPNSAFHVALRLAYPNAFDQRVGIRDRRNRLGSDIMIHGGDKSVGCVAVGDQAAEDLFVIAADAGIENVSVLIAPRDFRRTGEIATKAGQPKWVRELYADLDRRLRLLPEPAPPVAAAQPEPPPVAAAQPEPAPPVAAAQPTGEAQSVAGAPPGRSAPPAAAAPDTGPGADVATR